MSETIAMRDSDARHALKADLERVHCRVHQPEDPPLFTRQPRTSMVPIHWRWKDLAPLLDRLGQVLAIGSGGQRRTLRLANPGLPYGTTTSFWASIQVILPGEIAEAHRHSASAFRFIMHGDGATTTVDGERYPMNRGDLVLTPAWAWHDHTHHGDAPMIWLDVLDISLMRSLHATFFDPYDRPTQPVAAVPDRSFRAFSSGLMHPPARAGSRPARDAINPLLAYPEAMALAALEQAAGLPPDPFEDNVLEYRNPLDGGPVMTTMSMRQVRLRPGFDGRPWRHTGSTLIHVIGGRGSTVVDGRRFDWETGDFIAIPPWALHAHRNTSGDDARLFLVDDTPVTRALGYYREDLDPATEEGKPR